MAEKWKTEYHICDADGCAFDWLNTLEEAQSAAAELPGTAVSIERVTYYHNDRETVWERDA